MHHCVVVRGNDSACIRVWGGHHRVLYAWNNKLNASDANKDDGNDKVEDRNIYILTTLYLFVAVSDVNLTSALKFIFKSFYTSHIKVQR